MRQCQVLDLSRTGVRLTVTNAHSLSNTFTLILSRNSSGLPARVKWRRGTEVGAEFLGPRVEIEQISPRRRVPSPTSHSTDRPASSF
jgi:PilZ domain-containing protein